jgi:hypothetical protein
VREMSWAAGGTRRDDDGGGLDRGRGRRGEVSREGQDGPGARKSTGPEK